MVLSFPRSHMVCFFHGDDMSICFVLDLNCLVSMVDVLFLLDSYVICILCYYVPIGLCANMLPHGVERFSVSEIRFL
jgi:hypothetical protein